MKHGLRPSDTVTGHIDGLDGIRALAVIAVVAFHLWPVRFPGGFIGVDVFFVISGFLITTLLLRERRNSGWIDLVAFWRRRARRLLPAAVLVVTVSVIVAGVANRDLLVGIGRQTLGALTFSSNWLEIGAGSDYFDHTAPALFVTFWSLAVEEQFYLLWPLTFAFVTSLWKRSGHRVGVALALAVASAVWMAVLYTPGGNPTRVYYGTDTHLFGILVGVAMAFAFAGDVGPIARPGWWTTRRWLGFVAVAVLGVMVVMVDSRSAFTYRGGLVAASVLSAAAVASLPGPPSAFVALNRLRPLEWTGERSYGIYLWHWPVILVVTEWTPAVAPGSDPHVLTVVISLAVTAALTEASHRLVETPIRRHGFAVALAPVWEAVTAPRRGRRGVPSGSTIIVGVAAVAFVVAAVSVLTAPDKSEAQLAVERGQQAMAEAEAGDESPSTTEPTSSTTPDSAPTTQAPAPAWPVDLPEPPGDRIVGFGDSVLSGAAPAMYARFPGIRLDAKPIRQWKDAPALIEQAIADGTIRPVVVLNFGTNAGLASDESRAAAQRVLELLGPERRVVLVNIVGVSGWVPSSNETLAEIAARHPNVIVADWHAVVAADPSLLHTDRTHPNLAGIDVYADLVASALVELGPL